MVKKKVKQGVTNEKIMEVLLDMDGRIVSMDERMVTKADLADALKDYATKNDLERMKDEIMDVVKPVMKAVDRDAETIIGHGRRIAVLERRAGVTTK